MSVCVCVCVLQNSSSVCVQPVSRHGITCHARSRKTVPRKCPRHAYKASSLQLGSLVVKLRLTSQLPLVTVRFSAAFRRHISTRCFLSSPYASYSVRSYTFRLMHALSVYICVALFSNARIFVSFDIPYLYPLTHDPLLSDRQLVFCFYLTRMLWFVYIQIYIHMVGSLFGYTQ